MEIGSFMPLQTKQMLTPSLPKTETKFQIVSKIKGQKRMAEIEYFAKLRAICSNCLFPFEL